MAPGQMYGVLAIILTILPSLALATDFVVGDQEGWTNKFNYTTWAADKVFRVGDRLVFNYNKDNHNVYKVNGTAFHNCEVPPPSEALTSGSDIIPLMASGKKWYICGKPTHCSQGQKLVVNVQEALEVPFPSPTPGAGAPSSANGILASGYQAFAAAIAAIALLVIV